MAGVPVQCTNPTCKARGSVDESLLGEKALCKKCGGTFLLTRCDMPVSFFRGILEMWPRASPFEVLPGDQPPAATAPIVSPPAAEPTVPDAEPDPNSLLGEFVLEGSLGEGGMGTVSLVRSKTTGQRFAVKKAKFQDDNSRRKFLAELQPWLDLPEHPHLAACRSVRTEGDEAAVFIEYVDGGSLHAWLRDRKLTRLEDILDVAIQFARGLHAAHEAGAVHQDVKPGNALLTAEGVVKVTDLGLARARSLAGETQARADRSSLVSCGGISPVYCSPEQAAGRPLGRGTDVWSWGVSVLQMFAGRVFWTSGTAALTVLEGLVESGPEDGLPPLPKAVAQILRKCFRPSPTDRWASLDAAAHTLQEVARRAGDREAARPPATTATPKVDPTAAEERRSARGTAWADPASYLAAALREAGQDVTQLEALLPPPGKTRQAQAVADLAVYEQARRLLQPLVAGGRKDLESSLANLCADKAVLCTYVDDGRGAVALYDQALAIYEPLVHQGHRELAGNLAQLYMNKGNALRDLGDKAGAVPLYDQAGAIYEWLVQQLGRRELAHDLAAVYANKACVLRTLEDHHGAVALCDQAIAICEQLAHPKRRCELADKLAFIYRHKANALLALGDKHGAVALYSAAIASYERMVHQEGRRELAHDLATLYGNKATAVSALGDRYAAVALYDQAIACYEQLVHEEERRAFRGELAWVHVLRAALLVTLGHGSQAHGEARAAVEILKAESERTGRADMNKLLEWAIATLRDIL